MNNQKNQNGRGIFYGVIGVATLVVAIIGATFAYFTASQTNNNVITGNAASITFGLTVTRAETGDASKGLIPMSNTMVEAAVNDAENEVCVDDNGNSVCQVYKITVTNTSTASMFLDGYVTLADATTGSLGVSTDVAGSPTVMRWAQVFPSVNGYTTAGSTTTGATDVAAWGQIGQDKNADATGKNLINVIGGTGGPAAFADITTTGTIKSNSYDIINRNYIRTSKDPTTGDYDRNDDVASALVYNQYLENKTASDGSQTKDIYIVVWLSETGTNQTPEAVTTATTNGTANNFFTGTVTFNSAQGGEVSATFSGFTTVAVTD